MGSFSVALSGLDADSAALNIVSNNLANVNTTGYKDSSASFYDLLSQSVGGGSLQIGGGVAASQSESNFSQGSIQSSGGAFDGAIQGNGFFVVRDTAGDTLYTRAGNFQLDANGNLVTATGQFVQGWTATDGVVNTNSAIGNITIPSDSLHQPSATQNFTTSLNLAANGVMGTSTGTFSAPIQVIDSLGETHTLTINYTMTAANTWNYTVTIPGQDLTNGTAGTPSQLATGTLTFDSNGNLTSPPPPGQISVAATGLSDGASDLNMNWNLYNSNGTPTITQFASPSAISGTTQDGVASAEVTQVSIANGGTIVASFSDGTQQVIGQLAMASVANPDSLISVGQNNYEVSSETSTPVVGQPGTGSRGTIIGGALESSNVDIAQEFTNLIVYQEGYEANSKVVSTLDDLTQVLLNIKQ